MSPNEASLLFRARASGLPVQAAAAALGVAVEDLAGLARLHVREVLEVAARGTVAGLSIGALPDGSDPELGRIAQDCLDALRSPSQAAAVRTLALELLVYVASGVPGLVLVEGLPPGDRHRVDLDLDDDDLDVESSAWLSAWASRLHAWADEFTPTLETGP